MRPARSPIISLLTSAVATCATVLSLAWPGVLHADDAERDASAQNEAEIPPGAARFGNLLAASELVKDEKSGKVRVRLIAVNTSDEEEEFAQLETRLEKYEYSPDSRGAPPPEVAWKRSTKIVLPPGERFEREYLLPPEIAKAIIAADKAQKEQKPPEADDEEPPPVTTSYHASLQEFEPDEAAG
jgi:hypothetical protein